MKTPTVQGAPLVDVMDVVAEAPAPQKERPRRPGEVSLRLPAEFVALCARDQMPPVDVLKGLVADLCAIGRWSGRSAYATNGAQAQQAAKAYYAVLLSSRDKP